MLSLTECTIQTERDQSRRDVRQNRAMLCTCCKQRAQQHCPSFCWALKSAVSPLSYCSWLLLFLLQYMHMCACHIHACTYIHTRAEMYTKMHVCTHTEVCAHPLMCTYKCTHLHMHTQRHTHCLSGMVLLVPYSRTYLEYAYKEWY